MSTLQKQPKDVVMLRALTAAAAARLGLEVGDTLIVEPNDADPIMFFRKVRLDPAAIADAVEAGGFDTMMCPLHQTVFSVIARLPVVVAKTARATPRRGRRTITRGNLSLVKAPRRRKKAVAQ